MTVAIPSGLSRLPGVTGSLAAAETAQASLHQGLTHYAAEQIQAALQQWQQANLEYERQGNRQQRYRATTRANNRMRPRELPKGFEPGNRLLERM